ncbi:MAG TPA: FmdB family zinc ribbon protein [Trebonia sp.]|nr:FmdB family zinc ribbon protein [Trebonia sp.]
MPTYQYACTECGGQIEALQKFSDEPLTVHEACGGKLRKVFSPVGIVFKGSGFYRTDSRSGAGSSAPAAAASSDSGTSDSGTSDSKAASAASSSADSGSSSSSDSGSKPDTKPSGNKPEAKSGSKSSEKVA